MKLLGESAMVQEFDTVGVGQWFRHLTGLLEITGGVALLAPSYSALGAALLLVVDVGASSPKSQFSIWIGFIRSSLAPCW
jgi:hypothetical protein